MKTAPTDRKRTTTKQLHTMWIGDWAAFA